VNHLIAAAGGVSSRYDDILRVIIPGPAHTGPALMQQGGYNSDYLDSAYENGSAGSLWKMELIYYPTTTNGSGYKLPNPDNVVGSDLTDRGTDKEAYRWFTLHDNNTERDDWDALMALGQAFAKSGAELDAAVVPLIDGSEWARCFALQTLCGIGDSYTRGNNHNVYFYQRPADGLMLALPWDWDFAFYNPVSASIFGDQNTFKVLQRPQYLRLYYAHLQDLMNTVFTTAYMSYWTNHYDNFTPGQDFSPILTYIGDRRAYVLGQLPAAASLAISNAPAGGTLTASASLALTGTAPWGAAAVQLSGPGGTVDVILSSVDNWSATMPLLLGSNVVSLNSYNVRGVLLGTQSFTIVSTATSGFVDADGDGLPDAWEKANGLDALPNATAAATDSDSDGQSNAAEYLAGTNPRSGTSKLTLTATALAPGKVTLAYTALAGRNYRITYSDSLASGTWLPLATHVPANADGPVSATDTPGAPRRFYRLETP
jgi:hypothetical protein